ncbi:MAG: T9SS type A sorting domain-containing protein [Bacteroidetes bacterium]|nr:T9SS type A sorting domain-containing protein [Bacteroidota bacterium]
MKHLLHLKIISFIAVILITINMNVLAQHPTPYIQVIQPSEAGIEWIIGQTYLISWTDNLTQPVLIELANYGVTTPTFTTIAPSVQGSTYSWTIPNTVPEGNNFKINIWSTVNTTLFDASNNFFKIKLNAAESFIKVEQPSLPNITWVRGTTNLISWTHNVSGPFLIELANYGVTTPTFTTLASNVTGSTWAWSIPSDLQVGSQYKINVWGGANNSLVSQSVNEFTIAAHAPGGSINVLQPSALNISWLRGSSYLISWNPTVPGPFNIELANMNDPNPNNHTYHMIKTGAEGSTWVWSIPENTFPTGSKYKIIVWGNGNTIHGSSQNYFALADYPVGGTITVMQPSEQGITWLRGTSQLISWNPTIPGPFNIELANYGVTTPTFNMIKTGAEGSTWVWSIPENTFPTGTQYKINVWGSNNTIVGSSTHNFALADFPAGGSIEVLQPSVANIKWLRGTSHLISWNPTIPGPFNIELANYGVTTPTFHMIKTGAEGSTWVWPIPETTFPLGTQYKINVWGSNNTIVGSSANHFSLVDTEGGTIDIHQPNGGETLYKGIPYLISWIDNVLEPVNIELYRYDDFNVHTQTFTIESGVVGTTTVWNVLSTYPTSSKYKIRVFSSVSGTIQDLSSNYFTITDLPLTFTIYPNPANDYFTVKFDEKANETYTVQLFNRLNLPMLTRTVNAESLKEYRISTADLPNGVYFLTISSDKTKNTQKIIIQH